MPDQGQSASQTIGSGVVLAVDATFDLAIDAATSFAAELGLVLTGHSASQIV